MRKARIGSNRNTTRPWQVINCAQGKGGSGGRIDALEELHKNGVPLGGLDVSDAFLQEVDLKGANLVRVSFRSADIRGGSFAGSQLEFSDLTSANLRNANLQKLLTWGTQIWKMLIYLEQIFGKRMCTVLRKTDSFGSQ